MSDDPFALRVFPQPLPTTMAGRLDMVSWLLNPPILDDYGNVIGHGDPIISQEEALALLDASRPEHAPPEE